MVPGDDDTTEQKTEGTANPTADAASDPTANGPSEEAGGGTDDDAGRRGAGQDFRSILRQLTSPMVESIDARLRDQVEAHVDELMDDKIAAALRDRLSTLDRAIADVSRSLESLEHRVESIERGTDPVTS
jgi:hypothetical protein